jgi:F-box interacting protein
MFFSLFLAAKKIKHLQFLFCTITVEEQDHNPKMDKDLDDDSWVFVEKDTKANAEPDHNLTKKLKQDPLIQDWEQSLHDFSSSDGEKEKEPQSFSSSDGEKEMESESDPDDIFDGPKIEEFPEDYPGEMDFGYDSDLAKKFSSRKRGLKLVDYQEFPKHLMLKNDMKISDVTMNEALEYLPAKFLLNCKAVSKKWNHWISSSFFAHRQSTHFKDFSGLFCQLPGELPEFISIDSVSYGVPTPSLNFLPESVYIRDSCNGLVCCQSCFYYGVYYICNPVTKQWVKIPEPNLYHGLEVSIALAFEPHTLNFDANFEIVCVVSLPDHPVQYFEIYSSRTNTWRVAETTCCELGDVKLNSGGFYYNGILYWETPAGCILAFNLNNEEYGILPLPVTAGPDGVLAPMNGEICYILPCVEEDGDCVIKVYGNMDMSLKSEIPIDSEGVDLFSGKCRALSCVNDDTLILIVGRSVEAYSVKQKKMSYLGRALSGGYGKYLPYINTLAHVQSV